MKITSRIKDQKIVPYGGEYTATHPGTGTVIHGRTFREVYQRMIEHCRSNNLPIPMDFEDRVEEWVCLNHPNECQQYVENLPLRPRSLGWMDVLRGTKVMLKHWTKGRPLVSQEEADRRGKICAACPLNGKIQYGCLGLCGELAELLKTVAGSLRTPHDEALQSCGICHCFNRVSVWIELDVQWSALNDEMKSACNSLEWCWKKGTV